MLKEPPTPAEVEKMRAPVVPPVVYVRNDGGDGGNGGGGAVGGSGDDFHLPREQMKRAERLFNIESETTEDDIKQFMATTDVKCMEVECRSNQDARNKSFRVQIGEADCEKTMNADMWPANVGFRPYIRYRGNVVRHGVENMRNE